MKPEVCLVLPVYNEEQILEQSVRTIVAFLTKAGMYDTTEIIIAVNGSTDSTLDIARRLERENRQVRAKHITEAGRGRALKQCWLESDAHVLSYMDIDLSTDLTCYPDLIRTVASGTADIAIGSRLLSTSQTKRCFKREFISRVYNFLVRLLLKTQISDLQCGFKAISRNAVQDLLHNVRDNAWFFDTELLMVAQSKRMRVREFAVRWTESNHSTVALFATIWRDLAGINRLRRTGLQARAEDAGLSARSLRGQERRIKA